jgi:hypothetical protein
MSDDITVTTEMLAAADKVAMWKDEGETPHDMHARIYRAMRALEPQCWNFDMEAAPRDRLIMVWAAPRDGLDGFATACWWHPDAGFSVDELREVVAWAEMSDFAPDEEPPEA